MYLTLNSTTITLLPNSSLSPTINRILSSLLERLHHRRFIYWITYSFGVFMNPLIYGSVSISFTFSGLHSHTNDTNSLSFLRSHRSHITLSFHKIFYSSLRYLKVSVLFLKPKTGFILPFGNLPKLRPPTFIDFLNFSCRD